MFTGTERLSFARLFAGTERHSFARLIAGARRTRLFTGTERLLFAHLIASARRTRLFTGTERLLFARLIAGAHRTRLFASTERHSFTRLIAGAHRTRLFTSTERSHSSDHWYTQRTAGTESIHTALFTLTVFVLLICTQLQTLVWSLSKETILIRSPTHWCTQDSPVPCHREILDHSSDRWCLQNLSVSLARRDSYYCTLPLVCSLYTKLFTSTEDTPNSCILLFRSPY